jgi:hypothetical protein
MPFVLVVVGILMIVTGVQGTYAQFGTQVSKDFYGTGNFFYWLVAIGVVGAVGYYDPLRGISRLFMALVIISMVISNKGLFAKLQQTLASGPVTPTTPVGSSTVADNAANKPTPEGAAASNWVQSVTGFVLPNWISSNL